MHRTGQVFIFVGIWLGLGLLAYFYFEGLESPAAHHLSGGKIELIRAGDGHFHIDGGIDGHRLPFLIDTGASTVSISQATALQIGLTCQRQAAFRTANGAVQGCVTRVSQLDFGPFKLRDIAVAILPNLPGEALLGMNALKAVRMEQNGNRLLLSP